MYLVPKPGRLVPDPARGDYLPAEGREIEVDQYWLRRLQDDDVAETPRPANQPAVKAEK